MQPITTQIPKPLIAGPSGRTMLELQMQWISRVAKDVHVTVGYHKEKVAAEAIRVGASSAVVVGSLGNAAWITRSVLGKIESPVLVTTCDNLMEIDVEALVSDFVEKGSPSGMLVEACLEDSMSGDSVTSVDGVVTRLRRVDATPNVASGLQVLRPAKVRTLAGGSTEFTEVWARMIERSELYLAGVHPSKWIAVDRPEDLHLLETWDDWVGQSEVAT